jgi:hypothetical protein
MNYLKLAYGKIRSLVNVENWAWSKVGVYCSECSVMKKKI